MSKFNYRSGLLNAEIDIAKEMISYKGKTIPSQNIVAIGVGFTDMRKLVLEQLFGIIGIIIAKKKFAAGNTISKNLSEMPKYRVAQMIITYNEEDKIKIMRVPLNTNNEICIKMIETMNKEYSSKFVGYGGLPIIEKILGIKHRITIMVTLMIIVLITGTIIYGAIKSGDF